MKTIFKLDLSKLNSTCLWKIKIKQSPTLFDIFQKAHLSLWSPPFFFYQQCDTYLSASPTHTFNVSNAISVDKLPSGGGGNNKCKDVNWIVYFLSQT